MKIFHALLAVSVLFLSACASLPAKKNHPSSPIVGDYEVVSYETTECGRYGPMPMVGEAHFGDDGLYRIRMNVNWVDSSADNPFLELNGSFFAWPNNEIFLLESKEEDSEWVNYVKRYRLENRPDGRYLILITQLPKDIVKYEIASLKNRHDEEAKILRRKFLEGFEWTLKRK